jgi:cytochrome b5-like protein/Big-like domain-containing protein
MKKSLFATLLFVLTFSMSLAAQLPNYTLADVAKHNTPADCWIILNSTEVYNVTAYLNLHPAGAGPITPFCGANATTAFNNVGHSTRAVGLEATYLIGNLVTATTISVTLSPTTASLAPAQQQAFVASVANSTMGVTWSATSVGKIDQTGLYTAVNPGTGTVTATSVEDPTKTATAQVTVTSTPPTGGIAVTVSPGSMIVSVGGKQQFTANVTGSTAGVTWTATGAVGAVDSKGLFTATKVGQGVVKATSVDDPTKSASAAVTVTNSGPVCSLSTNSSGFNINCVPASMVPSNRYSCVATSNGKSTVVRCTSSGRTHGDD